MMGAILMDLSKAFDYLLISQVHTYGFDEDALVLTYSYLNKQIQYFQIINTFSNFDVETVEDFGGHSSCSNATLLTILKLFFYISQDLQTCFIICSQYKAHTNKGVTPLDRNSGTKSTKFQMSVGKYVPNYCHIL